MTWPRRILRILLILIGAGALASALIIGDVQLRYLSTISASPADAPHKPVAIVLGAGIQPDGSPSDALHDRLLVGAELYQQKKVAKILVTGDDGRYRRDETKAMRMFLENRGIPLRDILEDDHGYRTYESCKRAIQEFGIRDAILITQRFHIGRALYLCNQLGMNAIGVTSDLQPYRRIAYFVLRDLAASVKAWWDINILPPQPPV